MLGAVDGPSEALRRRLDSGDERRLDLDGRFALALPRNAAVHLGDFVVCVLLGLRGTAETAKGAAAAVAYGYEARGVEALRELDPPCAAVLWDRRRHQAILAVDPLATRPLFYARSGGGVVFGDAVAPILGALPTRPSPDAGAAAAWLLGTGLALDATMYEGIERIPGGHVLRLGGDAGLDARPDALATSQLPTPLEGSPDQLAETVWHAIESAVDRATATDESVGVLLSGGLDSGTIASALRGPRLRLAFSARFPGFPETDESELIQHVRDDLGMDGRWLVVRTGSMLRDALDYQRRWEVPSPSPTLMFQLPLAGLARTAGVSRLLSGEGGDELFGLRPFLLADRLRHGRLPTMLRLARALGGGRATVWDYGVKGAAPATALRARRRRAPGWLRPAHAQAARRHDARWDWKRLDGPAWQAQAWDELTAGRQRTEVHQYLRQRTAMTGIETAHPYLEDLDLIEFCTSLPPEQAFASTLDRPYLRAAGHGRLPERIRTRAEKSYFNAVFRAALDGPDRPAVEALLGPRAEVAEIVSRDFLAELVMTPPERRSGSWLWMVWRLATLECWLRFQRDRAFDRDLPGWPARDSAGVELIGASS
jgi:asparagine synthase (glutamine-hydrolysing)